MTDIGMDDLISKAWVLAEYDRKHQGPPGGARKIMAEAPTIDAIPVEWMKHRLTMALKNGSDAPEQAIRYVLWLWEQQKDGEQEAHGT